MSAAWCTCGDPGSVGMHRRREDGPCLAVDGTGQELPRKAQPMDVRDELIGLLPNPNLCEAMVANYEPPSMAPLIPIYEQALHTLAADLERSQREQVAAWNARAAWSDRAHRCAAALWYLNEHADLTAAQREMVAFVCSDDGRIAS